MKEIGGYFGLENFNGTEYHNDLIPLNNGRNALQYLVKAKGIRKLYIPFYLCDSVSDMLVKKGYDFEYYQVNADFTPSFSKALAKDEYLYIVNFYGQLTDELIMALKRQFDRIIIDNTHAFFQKPTADTDTIYSCRKFFGVPDGAYLSSDKALEEVLEIDVSKDRMSYILGRFEGQASDYYRDYLEINELYGEEPILKMSKLTHNILKAIDYEQIRQIRNENFKFLHNELEEENPLKLVSPDGPFAYPFYIENGIEVRKQLALKKIYIPTLWPNVLDLVPKESMEYQYAANILPLPCDQRYTTEDMKFMAGILKRSTVKLTGNK
ncbi:hypothetical protein [Metaplanococcus flavidus]|uniref:DegT/DnrJ/EryC1/StrS aminotransferase n=1 Tax=Metaplanococcus flavidus TaxID=569883 RepID=A0ABW3L9M4_9BACL